MSGLALMGAIPVLGQATTFSADFEAGTPGEQPTGDWIFSPGSNTATNGAVIVDGSTTPANPLDGRSLYVYDQNGDGDSGESTQIRTDFLGGDNISAARVSFDFQPMYTVGEDDDDTRVHFTIGQAGLQMNNSDFRLFEIRMQNNGGFRVEYSNDGEGGDRGSSEVASFDPTAPGEVVLFVNSHGSESVDYDDGTYSGTLAPNTLDVYLNGSYIGSYLTLKTPDPDDAPQVDFWASDADLGRIAFYQDSKRQGGVVFDNIVVQQLPVGGGGEEPDTLETYIELFDFEEETVGEQPIMPFPTSFSPSNNTDGNGFVVVDESSDPANPMNTGKALYAYDFIGDLSSGESSHLRFDFAPSNTDNVRLDFDFQRAYAVEEEDEDTRIHVGFAPAGTSTNNSDFRPFELRILNNGSLVVNYNPTGALQEGRDSEVVAQYTTSGVNSITLFANGNNGDGLEYDDDELGQGVVPANSMVLFLNGTKIGEYGFINTPDPDNAPQIAFFETTDDFGRLGIYQDSKRQGGIFLDNLSLREFAVLGPPEAPSELTATSAGPVTVDLAWTDNSTNETGFIIEQKDGNEWMEVGTAEADATSFQVVDLQPETTYTFRVLSTNGTPSEPSNEATVTTDEQLLPIITTQPQDTLIPSGSTTELSVEASGPGTLNYQWYEGDSGDTGTPVTDATTAEITTPVLQANTSFWVRVTNENGTADSEAALVEVFEPRTIRVVSFDQLEALLPDALPGDTYVIDNGVYPDAQISFEAEGVENAPITLRAETPGQVVFTGDSHLGLGGEWLVVEGFLFTNGWNESVNEVISFRAGGSRHAHNSRVTQCAIVDYSPSDPSIDRDWVGMYGTNNRFDHNYLGGHSTKGVTLVVWRSGGQEDNHRIDNNHFAFRADGGGENGWETIRVGTSSSSMSDSGTLVEYNLFEECNGEIEIISNKSGANVYRYNTFLRSKGMLTLRHGNDCIVEGNVFLGEGISRTGGIRVIGERHTVINNYIEGTTGRDGAAITVYAGVESSPLNEYFAAHDAFIGNNTIVDVTGAHIEIGAGFGSRERTILPDNVIVTNNLFAQEFRDGVDGPVLTGEAELDPLYAGNLHESMLPLGVEGGLAGFTSADLPFVVEDNLLRPTEGSAAIDAADGAYAISLDLDGQPRPAAFDVGADERSDEPGINEGGPLTAEDTGPAWLRDEKLPWEGEGIAEGDTVISPWFGTFIVGSGDYLWHTELGWIYVGSAEDPAGMWIWNHSLASWLYTSRDLFPVVYDDSAGSWRVYLFVSDDMRYVYDFTAGAWTLLP